MDERDAENVARLRRAYEAFSRGDFDRAVDLGVHPEIEYIPAGGQRPLRGIDEFRTWMEPDAFDLQQVEPADNEIAGNKALVRQHGIMRGAGSGIEMEVESFAVFTLDEEGLLIRLEIFQPYEEAEARRAAGLES